MTHRSQQILFGDCRQKLKGIEENSDQRKDSYGGVSPDKYVEWFLPISQHLLRVLKPTGTFILNIKERVVQGERHTYVIELILAMREQGWLWTEEFVWHKKFWRIICQNLRGLPESLMRQWLQGYWHLCRIDAHKGVSSMQLSKELGITQKSAWYMLQWIKEARRQGEFKLSKAVEVDETYSGGKERNKYRYENLAGWIETAARQAGR